MNGTCTLRGDNNDDKRLGTGRRERLYFCIQFYLVISFLGGSDNNKSVLVKSRVTGRVCFPGRRERAHFSKSIAFA